MSDALSFNIYDAATGTHASGVTCTVSAWNAFTGSVRTAPPVVERTGFYEVQPTDADRAAGTIILIDSGEGHRERYFVLAAYKPDNTNQFAAWLLTNTDGSLWSASGGTITGWTGATPATVFKIADGVFVVRPTQDDIAADASGLVTSPAGALPEFLTLDTKPFGESPDAPPPSESPAPVAPGQDSGLPPVGDVRLVVDEFLRGEVQLINNDLGTDAGLETAIYLSLFNDRYDDTTEEPTQRRGWWGDGLLDEGDFIGSRLWRFARAKREPNLPTLAKEYAREATQWLIDELVATRVETDAGFTGNDGWWVSLAVYRPNKNDPVRYRWQRTWEAQEKR